MTEARTRTPSAEYRRQEERYCELRDQGVSHPMAAEIVGLSETAKNVFRWAYEQAKRGHVGGQGAVAYNPQTDADHVIAVLRRGGYCHPKRDAAGKLMFDRKGELIRLGPNGKRWKPTEELPPRYSAGARKRRREA